VPAAVRWWFVLRVQTIALSLQAVTAANGVRMLR